MNDLTLPVLIMPNLSRREEEILLLSADGSTDEQIARQLSLSPATVNSYWSRIRTKLGVSSRTHAVAIYLRHSSSGTSATVHQVVESHGVRLLEHLGCAAILVDEHVRIIYMNDRWEGHMAVGAKQEPGQSIQDLGFPESAKEAIQQAVRECLVSGNIAKRKYRIGDPGSGATWELQCIGTGPEFLGLDGALVLGFPE